MKQNRIRFLRKQRGMTQDAVAKRLGYSSGSAIANIEAGRTELSADKAIELAAMLGVTVPELYVQENIPSIKRQKMTWHLIEEYVTGQDGWATFVCMDHGIIRFLTFHWIDGELWKEPSSTRFGFNAWKRVEELKEAAEAAL